MRIIVVVVLKFVKALHQRPPAPESSVLILWSPQDPKGRFIRVLPHGGARGGGMRGRREWGLGFRDRHQLFLRRE